MKSINCVVGCALILLLCFTGANAHGKRRLQQRRTPPSPSPALKVPTISRVQRLGFANETLDNSTILYGESPVGTFTCDSIMSYVISRGLNVSGCLINAGAITGPIPQGDVSLKELQTIYPYNNSVVVVTLTGEQIIKALDNGVSAVGNFTDVNSPSLPGRFPQVGGLLRFHFNESFPVGRRIVSARLGYYTNETVIDEAIDPCSKYTIVTNDYVAGGGDGYSSIAKGQKGNFSASLLDVLVDRFRWTLLTPPYPVLPSTLGRIVSCSQSPTDQGCVDALTADWPRRCVNGSPADANGTKYNSDDFDVAL